VRVSIGLGVGWRSEVDLTWWFFASKASTLAQWRWICHSGGGCALGEEYVAIQSVVSALLAVERRLNCLFKGSLPIDIGIK
jgi:hypothetical protein